MKINGHEFTLSTNKEALDLINKTSIGWRDTVKISFKEKPKLIIVGDVLNFNGVNIKVTKINKDCIIGEVINEHTNKKD